MNAHSCYFFRLLLRAIVQFISLTPKPLNLRGISRPEPSVGAIIGTNLLCLLLHVFGKAPAAGEATRFYLHGGLALDFIGQKGPTSKLMLVLLDLLVVALQLVHLSAIIARQKLKDGDAAPSAVAQPMAAQDLDSEERGVRRSIELQHRGVQESIELQSLNTAGRAAEPARESDEDEERRNAALESTAPRSDEFLFDAFKNGQIVLADLNPLKTAQEQIIEFQDMPLETRRGFINAQLNARMSEWRRLTGRR